MEIYIFAKLIYALYVKAEKDFLTKFKFFWILNNKKNDVHLNSSLEEKIYKYFFLIKIYPFFLDLDPRGTQQSFLRGRKTKSRSSDGRC